MDFKYKNIALSGVAGCGKNTVSEIVIKFLQRMGLESKELSIAMNLKKELIIPSKKLYGVDSFNCSREEKDLIRPFLVAHGQIKRNLSQGRHWIDKLTTELDREKINIITDVRFNEFEKDEVFWVKNEINGVLIHVSRFCEKNGERIFIPPANAAEKENDPKVKNDADFILNWPTEENEVRRIFNCEKLLKWLQNIYAR
tara:strand:- start:762 stop:1358 length:597 start_codon:yes stop_codon:yes gene_type:complete